MKKKRALVFGILAILAALAIGLIAPSRKGYESNRKLAIMGQNTFTVDDAEKYFGIKPTAADRAALAEIPWSEAELQAVKDTHVLIAVLPISLMEMVDKFEYQDGNLRPKGKFFLSIYASDDGRLIFDYGEALEEVLYAQDRGKAEWVLLRRGIIPGSLGKSWRSQLRLLHQNEAVPPTRVAAYSMVAVQLKHGTTMFDTDEAWLSDTSYSSEDSRRYRSTITFDKRDGIIISGNWGYWDPSPNHGLASMRKPSIVQ